MATQNSIDSYIDLCISGQLGEKQKLVYEFIKNNPNCTYNEISRGLKEAHNTVTARIKELREYGFIVRSGDRIDERTGKKNTTYRIREEGEDSDATIKDVCPKIPESIRKFLTDAVKGVNKEDVSVCLYNGVKWQAGRVGNNIGLKYGDFVSLRNIMVACEVIEQNRFLVTGQNFTVFFRIK